MNTALLIMAAGIGSRFGDGLKQLAPVGEHDEVLMEYAIWDAVSVGFNKIIFIIRREIEEEFHRQIGSKLSGKVEVHYCFQETDKLPKGYRLETERKKPWGTGQAVLAAADLINEPFAVINADDYYGRDGFEKIHRFLVEEAASDCFCMAGFLLGNTLSDNGAVTRGVCRVSPSLEVLEIQETSGIVKTEEGAACMTGEEKKSLDTGTYVSMNMWGFSSDFIRELEKGFCTFLDKNGKDSKAEYLLPTVVDSLIKSNRVKLKLLPTNEKWYGMTYKEDTEGVRTAIREMIQNGKYPNRLFERES